VRDARLVAAVVGHAADPVYSYPVVAAGRAADLAGPYPVVAAGRAADLAGLYPAVAAGRAADLAGPYPVVAAGPAADSAGSYPAVAGRAADPGCSSPVAPAGYAAADPACDCLAVGRVEAAPFGAQLVVHRAVSVFRACLAFCLAPLASAFHPAALAARRQKQELREATTELLC